MRIFTTEDKITTGVRQKRAIRMPASNKGSMCPFKVTLCAEGYCRECQIYLNWLKLKKKSKG